jgi:ELWxxDGT repeat protein
MRSKITLAALALALFATGHISRGQAMLKDLSVGSASSAPEKFVQANGSMYFVTTGANYVHRVWKSDGTANGTVILKDSIITTNVGNVVIPIIMNDTLYYVVNPNGSPSGVNRASLWKSDGTTAGTVLIDSLVTNSPLSSGGAGYAQPRNYIAVGNKLFFQMGKGDGLELWVTDGTTGGVHQVIDLAPGSSGSAVLSGAFDAPMGAYNGKVYFQGTTSGFSGDNELYVSDGTAAGTMLVKDINPGSSNGNGSQPSNWIVYNNELYFYANGGTGATGIWKTDGTSAGTVFIAAGSFTHPVIFKNEIYFENGNSIWKTDGTAAGTVLAINNCTSIRGANSDYLIAAYYTSISVSPYIAWHYSRTDGTTADTISTNAGYGASFVVLNNKMYNYGVSATNGLWSSDGTETGSGQLATNISQYFFAFNGNLYYSGWGTGTGYELWWLNVSSLGVSQLGKDQDISVYPNPSSGIFYIENSTEGSLSVNVFSLTGERVALQTAGQSGKLDLSYLPNGLYFLQCALNGHTKTQKIIINK